MKIRKTPSKKLAVVPRPLRDLIKSLEQDSEEQIAHNATQIKDWTYPRGDLFHWVGVLNRFDSILQRTCGEYDLQHIQSRDFDVKTKDLLLAITNLSTTLFENCTNRNIYNSYEHMNALINTTDIDVLEAVLRFTLRPAQRVNNPRAIRSSFVTPQDKIIELARGWGIQADFVDMCKDDFIITEDMTQLKIRFYRTRQIDDDQQKDTTNTTATATAGASTSTAPTVATATPAVGENTTTIATTSTKSTRDEGINVVTAQMSSENKKSDIQVFQDLVNEHNIPKEYQFELANQIRITRHITNPEERRKLLTIRILSIAIMAHTVSETTAQNKVFIYEPHLVASIAELIHPEKQMPNAMQVYALCALDGVARHRGKLSEVLTALNASANHGVLLQILRKISQDSTNVHPRSFLDALFTLMSCLLTNQPGGQMLISAGVIPILVQILGNQQCIFTKFVSKVVGLLDAIVNAYTTSFSAFCNAGGLDTLLARIKIETEQCIQFAQSNDTMDTGQTTVHVAPGALAPYDRISALKSMFKFLLRMMESSGTTDGLRNLIESSVPQSLIKIIAHPDVFGVSVLTLAINIMTTFIHTEPTSLPILQEAKLPQTFLEIICKYNTPNSEMLMASVNAFGAICLNPQGLEMFNKAKPLPHFFDLLTEHDFLRNAAEVDNATALGSTMDELTRHHPSLKPAVFECVARMIRKVVEMGKSDVGKPSDDSHLLKLMPSTSDDNGESSSATVPQVGSSEDVEMSTVGNDDKTSTIVSDESKKDDKPECLLVSFIDMVARFLEGLFQNAANIRDFVQDGCPEILLDYYTLPLLPADFSVTIASDSLAYIFKMISETSTLPTILAIAEKAKHSIKLITEDKSVRRQSMIQPYIDVKENETEKIKNGNELFRQLIILHGYIGLLSNICCSAGLAPGKNATSLVTEFMAENEDNNIILLLGQLHRIMMWENFLLKDSMPSSWYAFKMAKKNKTTVADHPLGIFGVDTTQEDTPQPEVQEEASSSSATDKEVQSGEQKDKAEEKVPDANDPRMQNIKHFKLLLGDIPQFLMPVFQGLVKVSISRRAMEAAQKAQTFKLANCMSQLLKENLTWSCATMGDAPPCKYDYLATMYTMVSLLHMDDRPQASLHTPMALTFDRQGGTDLLLQNLDEIWKAASVIHVIPKESRTKEQTDLLPRIYGSLEMLLTVLVYIGSPKLLHDSPYTGPIVVKDHKSPDYFDPYEWIITMQLKLSIVKRYLHSPDLSEFSKTVIHVLLDIILEILKGDGESRLKTESFNVYPSSAGPSLTSPFTLLRQPIVADERGVQRLVDMGFNRTAAEHAMVRCSNQISRAVDYLFSHPAQMMGGPGGNGAGSSSGAGAGESAGSGQGSGEQNNSGSNNDNDATEADNASSSGGNNTATAANSGSDSQEQEQPNHDDPDDSDLDDASEDYESAFSTRLGSEPVPQQPTDETGNSDKGKQKAEQSSEVKELEKVRSSMKTEVPPLVLDLVDKREDVIFDVRDLLVTLCKNKASDGDKGNKIANKILSLLIQKIDDARQKGNDAVAVLSTRLRLLALLFREPSMQSSIPECTPRLSFLFDMVNSVSTTSVETPLPSWLTTVFLVVETFISQADEPKEVKLEKPLREGENDSGDDDDEDEKMGEPTETEENQKTESSSTSDTKPMESDPEPIVSTSQRTQLLSNCVSFLKKTQLSRNDIYAILRILVRLTKYNEAALEFVEFGGLPLLFTKPRQSLEGLQGQQAFIILILRHIIESKAMLESSMEDLITTWFTIPRPRNIDISTFIRNNGHIALREPSTFLEVSSKICRLTRYDRYQLNYQVKLLNKDDTKPSTANEPAVASSSSNNNGEGSSSSGNNNNNSSGQDVTMANTQEQQQQPPQPQRHRSSTSTVVINHLLQELVQIRSEETNAPEKKTTDAEKKAENIRYAYTGFILQCLVELVSSYKSCKYDVYSFGRRRSSKDGNINRPRHAILHMLINDLLPYNAINPTAEDSRKQQGLSMWTASVLVAMCYDAGPETSEGLIDNNNNGTTSGGFKDDLTQVRKFVFDGVIRSLKETVAYTGPLATKYGRFLALADLCHRILNARPNAGAPGQRAKEDTVTNIARIMLDRNFVGALTAAISEVDINYPHAKTVLNSMLRPLEQLTKMAIKISDEVKEDDKKREEVSYVPTNAGGEGEEEPPPDLYRTSALGMFDGSVMEEDEMDEFGSEEEDEETFDEDEFDEETDSDISDMSEDGEEDDDVDEEMGAMMHHFDTDMEDDDDEDGTDEEHHDTHGSDDDSDIDSDDSDEIEEEGREMTWRLEDIEDDPDVIHMDSDEVESTHAHDMRHRHLTDGFGDDGRDDELDTLDQSDFDEDDESQNLEDAENDDLNDGVLLEEEDGENPFMSDLPLPTDGIILEGDGRQGSMAPFNFRRFERPLNRGRLIVEPGRSFRTPGHMSTGAAGVGQDDVITHPLLSENQNTSSSIQPGRSLTNLDHDNRPRSGGYTSWQAFEDIIGGSAVRLLESFLTQAPGGPSGPLRVDVQGRTGGVMRTFEFDHLPHAPRPGPSTSHRLPGAAGLLGASGVGESQGSDQSRELMAVLHDFQPMTSSDRWQQEARMMYGAAIADKALKLTNSLLNALIPIAIEDEKKARLEEEERRKEQRRIEEEKRKEAEEEKWRREEMERKKMAEEEERQRAEAEAAAAAATASATTATNESQEASSSAEGEQSTGQGQEVQQQQDPSDGATQGEGEQQERQTVTISGQEVDISGTGIDIEFLEALPDDLREEVVNQHMNEQRTSTQAPESDSISSEFLDALPPDIREEVLNQEAIERERRERQQRQDTSTPATGGAAGAATSGTATSATTTNTVSNRLNAAVNELFTPGMATEENPFLRFLQRGAAGRRGLHGHDAAGAAAGQRKAGVHRSAMQLVDRTQLATLARLLFVPQSISKTVLSKLLINLCENNKTRSDLLSFLVCVLHDGSGDLAAVDRSFAQLSLQAKGIYKPISKAKVAATTSTNTETVPNLITQRCLEFLMQVVQSNEQSLTYFLVENDCLAGLKRTSSRKGKAKEKATPSSKYPLLVLMSLLDRPVFIENPSLMEELMHLIITICRPFPILVKKYVEKLESKQKEEEKSKEQGEKQEGSKTGDETASKPSGKSSSKDERPMPKPPTIPDHYLKLVVHVLTSGECSSKTFQYTLSALAHLSALDGAQQAITNELVQNAKESGKQIMHDLGDLLDNLDNAMAGTDIQGAALSQFAAATSHQAKLLRVLKTIDYLYSRKSSTTKKNNKDDEEQQAKNEKRVLEIYEDLNFLPLWKLLGQCLAVIHEKDDLINVATVLLPLIESFMVVSKYAAEKGQQTVPQSRSGASGPPASPSGQQQQSHPPPAPAEQPDDFFFAFTEEHKKILNIMVRNNPSLMIGSFSLLVRNPKMLEFDNKRNYFVQQLHKRTGPREHYQPLQMNVRRQYVFEDSYHQLLGRTGDEIKYGKLSVRFYDEEGVDAGGVAREWFSVLARQMFDPNYALFITSAADKLTYQPNRASAVNPDHLSYLKFVGRVIGKAIYDGRLLDAYFTRSFYKHILGRQVDYKDVEAVDPEYYKSLVWMLDNDITDVIDLTFSIETDDFGTTKVIDLKPGGRDIPVTEENKHEYVALVTEQKLTTAIKDQINAFLQGFHDVIPTSLIQIFNEQELELLISGLPDIDIDDWKNNTEYQGGYSHATPQVQWFWRAVRSFDQEERAKLLQFATGTSKVPLEGFAHLQGSGGVQKFQIHKDFGGDSRLPSAHTCFNQVDLPEYDSYESLRSNLFKAISECSTGFGFI
ncbi:hypothetical protein BDA99DRAFT_478483 [Phascolomyces articulosus]|uniref:HECT-type E3 ubiquitin transferase n=1 Tax=Phascolomyces articulosus TaxID=60185 RepID=A0AAD5K5N8_9FUNG|nr:hypothetical protein BDA99DRAFT_478483 [Phascolomyces articulosus]